MRSILTRLYVSPDAGTPVGAMKAARPSVLFLVLLNGLIFFGVGAVGNHVLGIVFHVPVTLMFMFFSALPQIFVRRVAERSHFLKPLPRTLAYLSPLALIFLAGLVLPRAPQKPNHLNPASSPDGRYEARFSSPSPGWDVVVEDKQTGKKWKEETPFLPHFQIYWRWDAANRLWIYNSDDAGIHVLEPDAERWVLRRWGWSQHPEPGMGTLTPPPELYPEYERTGS